MQPQGNDQGKICILPLYKKTGLPNSSISKLRAPELGCRGQELLQGTLATLVSKDLEDPNIRIVNAAFVARLTTHCDVHGIALGTKTARGFTRTFRLVLRRTILAHIGRASANTPAPIASFDSSVKESPPRTLDHATVGFAGVATVVASTVRVWNESCVVCWTAQLFFCGTRSCCRKKGRGGWIRNRLQ